MDTIDTFLDAMFAPYPATPRLLEAKGELRAMMEDAYADAVSSGRSHNEAVGQVITDFGNLEELAPALGILPDLRSARAEADLAPGPQRPTTDTPSPSGYPVVTLPEAQELAEARRTTSSALGTAVCLFVVAAVPLVTLQGLIEAKYLAMDEDLATSAGMIVAVLIVAAGVMLLMRRSRAFAGVRHLLQSEFTRDPIVESWSARLRLDHEPARTRALTISVMLWILSSVPLLATGMTQDGPEARDTSVLGLAGTLVIVAAGLRIYLPTAWAASTYDTLHHQGRPAGAGAGWRDPEDSPFINAIASVYWLLTLALYLGWSFIGDAWERSWIVWPLAGVFFGILAAGDAAWRAWHNRTTSASGA